MTVNYRLSPTMVSRKLQALRFIKEYFAEFGKSPSLGEIGNALGVSRQRAAELVQQLETDKDIVRKPGGRGILLTEPALMLSRSDALLILQAAGWKVRVDGRHLGLPTDAFGYPLTDCGLPLLPELDHIPDVSGENSDDRTDGG